MILSLAKHMPISAVAKHVGEHDTRIWHMLHHYVDKAHAATSWEGTSTIAGDETAARKGHRYVTVEDARRRAKGYRNFKNFRAIAYWIAGHLNLHVDNPSVAPTL